MHATRAATTSTTMLRRMLNTAANAAPKSRGIAVSVTKPVPPRPRTPAELAIADKLVARLQPSHLLVEDMSGGCGSMYLIEVISSAFEGLSTIKQHRLVTDTLAEDIKTWHGLQLTTAVPKPSPSA